MSGPNQTHPAESSRTGTKVIVMVVAGIFLALTAAVAVVALVFVVIIAGLTLLGASLNEKFEAVGQQVQPAGQHLRLDAAPSPWP